MFLKTTNGELTENGTKENFAKLASNFPKLDGAFYSILADRVRKNGFDDEMLTNAVDSLIDNYQFPEPKVADILSLNSNVEIFTYHDIVKKNDTMNWKAFEYYRPIKIPGLEKPMYASVNDIAKYNLTPSPIKEY